jgi:starch synthase
MERLKVLFLSPEAVPFAKTGGLADIAGSLPEALKRRGAEVRVVHPFYTEVRKGGFKVSPLIDDLAVPLGEERLTARVLETRTNEGVPVYLVERDDLYDRPGLYGNAAGDYHDNLERFAFFSHAALLATEAVGFKPDLIHCHDWQTGLVPALLKGPYQENKHLGGTPTVFTIHNLAYQGLFPAEEIVLTGLSKAEFFHPEGLEFWGKMSLLKSGIMYSDAITTVSPTYAQEIQTNEYGKGMEGALRQRRNSLHGILNGVDYSIWDPSRDAHVARKYSPGKMAGKRVCKGSLIKEMNLDNPLEARPLLGVISRLDTQKGLDLLLETLSDILALDVGLVVLGTGDESIREAIQKAAGNNRGRVGLKVGFDEPLAHRIMAGVDMFLVPSRYEPCGLTQMYALKYGTVPVVRATGGLEDTVVPFDHQTGVGNGFKFVAHESHAFLAAIKQGVDVFNDAEAWTKLMGNGMEANFSWDRSAERYMEVYRSLVTAE